MSSLVTKIVNEVKELKKRNDSVTPMRYRKLGKSINLLGMMIQVATAGMQLSGGDQPILTAKQYLFFVLSLAGLQWLGSTITDFNTEEPKQQDDDQPI